MGTALKELERIECGAWKGEAARAFAGHMAQDVTPLIRKSHASFDKAARALHRWAVRLEGFQDEADKLEKAAGRKLQALGDARTANKDDLSEESGAVNELTNQVHELEDRYKSAAALISKDLDKAGDIAPNEPGFWHRLVHGVKDAWDATVKWVQDYADVIKMIGDALSLLSAALGVLAIVTAPFEPIGAVFATAAMVTSGRHC
ncbi:hypothetical protein NKH77_30845 [Streptomyces sp. M19]